MNTNNPEEEHLTKQQADIEWDTDGQPVSRKFDDVYFSKENGLEESHYVFLQGNNLSERFSDLGDTDRFRIAETGFGTGLNFLATWQLWEKQVTSTAALEYISIEKFPLSAEALEKALSLWPELETYSQRLTAHYPPQPWNGTHRLVFRTPSGSTIHLTLYFKELENALKDLSVCPPNTSRSLVHRAAFGESRALIDAWFLDGFAPSKNPEMWTEHLFESMAANSRNTSSFATFTAAGRVKRGLSQAGFDCKKIPGFGRKREMLIGCFNETKYSPEENHPVAPRHLAQSELPTWVLNETRLNQESEDPSQNISTKIERTKTNRALIVGAGLAGAHLAFALAQRGIQVTVLEKNRVASGASSNFQGAVYSRLSASEDPLSEFNKQAQLYADQFYQQHEFFSESGDACGVLHLCTNDKERDRLKGFSSQFLCEEKFQFLNPEDASKLAKIDIKHEALFVKNSGWLHPQKVCEQLLQHKNITVFDNTEILELEQQKNVWRAHSPQRVFEAELCVICNAKDALTFTQSAHLPINTIRGQVSHCESNSELGKLNTVICGEGYLCPAADWQGEKIHSLGATFNLRDNSAEIRQADHKRNLEALVQISSNPALSDKSKIHQTNEGNVGFRCTSPDYFPIVGPLPNLDEMTTRFSLLGKKANAKIDECGAHYPGLYCSLAYGSRGLAYAPLTASLLADLITGSYLPVSRNVYSHLHPARFAIRALIKNKTYPK